MLLARDKKIWYPKLDGCKEAGSCSVLVGSPSSCRYIRAEWTRVICRLMCVIVFHRPRISRVSKKGMCILKPTRKRWIRPIPIHILSSSSSSLHHFTLHQVLTFECIHFFIRIRFILYILKLLSQIPNSDKLYSLYLSMVGWKFYFLVYNRNYKKKNETHEVPVNRLIRFWLFS